MLENVRADYVRHGRSLTRRAFWALAIYRYGRWTLERRFPPVRWITSKSYGALKMVSEIITGVIMDRSVQVGEGFHIVHPENLRIHPGVVIGDRVGIMHSVTIGTNMRPGVPVIGNDVFIGCGATILGRVRVGDGARIAANTLVIDHVPAGAIAMGVPARIYFPSGRPMEGAVGPQTMPERLPPDSTSAGHHS